ncbi:MAG TPA: PhoPQ-activated protein PqaA family protein [Sedimentisphaerales bacterium]|nr:PhoPQ-activated protein PqaA family protein [Sedimentisphaerales bacterium]
MPSREDALIAYCWDKFLTTGEEIWVMRLPMTKRAGKKCYHSNRNQATIQKRPSIVIGVNPISEHESETRV